jgi:hypothetical protein
MTFTSSDSLKLDPIRLFYASMRFSYSSTRDLNVRMELANSITEVMS